MKLTAAFAISGKVTTSAGVAIANAYVSADGSSDSASDTTDAAGNYIIRGLDAGTYQVLVGGPVNSNYLYGYYTTLNAAHFTRTQTSASNVVVGPNKVLLTIKLPTGYKIGGTISGAAVGVLANAYVTASGPNGSGSAVTNSLGKYLIQGLPAGTYKVELTAPFDKNFQDGWYTTANVAHFTTNAGSATNVTIGP
jgi:hypothetical protein